MSIPHYTGGSTGEPVRFVQDREFATQAGAVTLLYSKLLGAEVGDPIIKLWGSERDIVKGSVGWKAQIINRVTNTIFLNAYRMGPKEMCVFAEALNIRKPKLIVGYADAVYHLAKFCEREGLKTVRETPIMTSATTLYPFMREKIEDVFRCQVFNRYGSREMGDIACERPGVEGLWIAPWNNFVEVVDERGSRAPDGTAGEIVVTSLTNFAMPLVRYHTGDRGVLSTWTGGNNNGNRQERVLTKILGRVADMYQTRDGTFIEPGYFEAILYFKDWIRKFQTIQKSHSSILFRIVRSGADYPHSDLNDISKKTKLVMGKDCDVTFEFVDDISPTASGKYRYQISEIRGAPG
ncbi:MAG TPA: capsule biosynthesis protein CapK [Deltaproteobacteria bacterium]|nr:capsule biosynthesis protein CapK [Deltaproteobacteria bacterium]